MGIDRCHYALRFVRGTSSCTHNRRHLGSLIQGINYTTALLLMLGLEWPSSKEMILLLFEKLLRTGGKQDITKEIRNHKKSPLYKFSPARTGGLENWHN